VVLDGIEPTAAAWDHLAGHELLSARAPVRFWTAEVLMGRPARAAWCAPDRAPLPPELERSVDRLTTRGHAA
jgi:hypothetical protein